MTLATLTGNDSMVFTIGANTRVLNDYADGDVISIDFPNDIVGIKQGKNNNTLYALNQTGQQCTVTMRLLKGSSDDIYFNDLYESMKSNFSGFVLMNAQFIKKLGDGRGNITRDIYQLTGGIFSKGVNAKDNQEGDTEQSVTVYNMTFGSAPRSLG